MSRLTKTSVFTMISIALTSFASPARADDNLFFNSSFEMGDAGYSMIKYLRPDTNKKLEYLGVKVDTGTSVFGRQSLAIPNPYQEMIEFFSNEFKLKPNTKYALSLFMKSDTDRCPVMLQIYSAKTPKFDVKCRKFFLNKKWNKYHFTFKTGPGVKQGFSEYYKLKIRSCWKKSMPAATIWLDGLRLTEGSEIAWEPGADIEATFESDKSCYIGSDELITNIIVRNNSEKARTLKLTGIASDSDRGVTVESKPISVTLAPHATEVVPCEFNLKEYGAYQLDVKQEGSNEISFKDLPLSVAIIGKYDPKKIDLYDNFAVSVLMTMYRKARGVDTDNFGFCCWNSSFDDKFALLNKAGVRLIRTFSTFRWQNVEPEDGKFQFNAADSVVNSAARHHIQLMPVLGSMTMIDRGSNGKPQDWLVKKSQVIEEFPLKCKYKNGALYLPPVEIWNRYVKNVVQHYKGKVFFYEVMNEPNLMFYDASHYMTYLKAAYELIQDIDPKAKTVGLCVTGDFGGNVAGFLERCLELGAKNYCDIISFHPYNARRLSSKEPADIQIETLKKLIAKYPGKNAPIWNTELFFLKDNKKNPSVAMKYDPQDLITRTLTDLGEGVGQSICVLEKTLWKPTTPNMTFDSSVYVPSGAFVALNAIARIFEGAKPLDKIRWGCDTICYVYERNGEYLAAFWNYGGLPGIKLSLPINDAQAQLCDLYGNPRSLKQQPLNLTDQPYYLIWKGQDQDAFISLLKKAKVTMSEPVIPANAIRLLYQHNQWFAIVTARNYLKKTLNMTVDLESACFKNTTPFETSIMADTEKTMRIPVELTNDAANQARVKFSVNDKSSEFPVNVIKTRPAALNTPQDIELSVGKETAKCQATFKTAKEGDTLSLFIDVKDNTPSGAPGERKAWTQDGVELFFDLCPERFPIKYANAYHDRMFRAFILPYAPKGKQLIIWGSKSKRVDKKKISADVKTNPNGYFIKLDIPLSALNLDKGTETIGFDIKVNDAKGEAEAKSSLSWSSLGNAHCDRLSFGNLELGSNAKTVPNK